jgi:DNA-binding NarL/FixJ family response regulator
MTIITETEKSLYLATADSDMARVITDALPAIYDVSQYKDINGLLDALKKQTAELVLCHQFLLDDNPSQVISQLKKICPDSRILVIGPPRPIPVQIAALKQGARGYFNQNLPMSKLQGALLLISNGEVWVERHVISGLIDEISHIPEVSQQQRRAAQTLSPKELEVAKMVSHGATNKMIARNMNITERTVKAHLTTIFQKMNLPDRLSLAIVFRDLR